MKRILLKISWEAFSWSDWAIDITESRKLWDFISEFHRQGYQIAIVLGGGNIYRGSKLIEAWLNPTDSHSMSMLSTVFNAVTLRNILDQHEIESVVLDALHVEFLQVYTSEAWKKYLQEGKIVICSSGTGNPFFTTDTTWVLRALELNCEAVIKLTKVDGVYSKDPLKHDDVERFSEIRYNDFIAKDLQVFDTTGIILARDNNLPLFVSKIGDISALRDILSWKQAGTKIF